MSFVLRGNISGRATWIHLPDGDSDSPEVHVSRWRTKKNERISMHTSKSGSGISDGHIRIPVSTEKRSKIDRRLRPAVKQLPQSILTLVRFVVKKTLPSRKKGRTSERRREKQTNLSTAGNELFSREAVASASSQHVTPASAMMPGATVVTEEGEVHETFNWRRPLSRIKVVQRLSMPVTVQDTSQEVEMRLRGREGASTTATVNRKIYSRVTPHGYTNNRTKTRQRYGGDSSLWQSEARCDTLKQETRQGRKVIKPSAAGKLCYTSKSSLAVPLICRCICKRASGLPRRRRRTMKASLPFSLPQAGVRREGDEETQSREEGKVDNTVKEELAVLPSGDRFALRWCCHVVQAWEEKRNVERSTDASLSLAVISSSALTAESRRSTKAKEARESEISGMSAGGYMLNERNAVQGGKYVSLPNLRQEPFALPLVVRGKASAEYHSAVAENITFLVLDAIVDNISVQCTHAHRQKETVDIRGVCEDNKPCVQQEPRCGSDAQNVVKMLFSGDGGPPVEAQPHSVVSYIDVSTDSCTKERVELLRFPLAGEVDDPPFWPCSRLQGILVTPGDAVSSSLLYAEQSGSHKQSSVVDTTICRSCQPPQEMDLHAAEPKRKGGVEEEHVCLEETVSRSSRALLHLLPSSSQTFTKDASLLCPQQNLLWNRCCPPCKSVELSALPCDLSGTVQQAAVRPRRSILVAKNTIVLKGAEESSLKHECRRKKVRNLFWIWNCLFTKRTSKKRHVQLRFETVECIAYYSVYQPPAAKAFYRYTRLSKHAYFGDKALRLPLQRRKKGVKELKSGMTAEEAIRWSLSSRNARTKFAQCNAV